MDISIDQMAQDLARASYARRTQRAYTDMIVRIRDRLGKPVATWTRDDVRSAVEWLASLGKSASWLTQRYCALRFLFKRTLGKPELVSFLKLPKVYSPLPTVLSLDEVHALLRAIREPRYQAIAMVMYGASIEFCLGLVCEPATHSDACCVRARVVLPVSKTALLREPPLLLRHEIAIEKKARRTRGRYRSPLRASFSRVSPAALSNLERTAAPTKRSIHPIAGGASPIAS